MPYPVESFGITDIGLSRPNNEDIFHEIPMHRFFALADGMGGHNAGEIAAKELVYHLAASVCQFSASPICSNQAPQLLYNAILQANRWVHQLSEQKLELSGMGSTLCCLLLHEEALICAHVGDSRIYRFRQKLQQLTRDHTLLNSSGKTMITRAIGTTPHVEPEILRLPPVKPGDVYLLCSDGLTDYVEDTLIADILKQNTCIKSASTQMVKTAKNNGGHDNITILAIKILHHATHISRQ